MPPGHLIIATLLFAGASFAAAADPPPEKAAPADAHFFVDHYCVKCHGGDSPKADLNLEPLAEPDAKLTHLAVWQQVLEKLENHEMPPKSKPRPPAEEARAALDWIYAEVAKAKAEQRATEGRVVLRRLNRTEYENTVRDLLGVEVHVRDMLPEDSLAADFDNVGDALHTSSFLLARYLEAAEAALDEAIASQPQPKEKTLHVSLAKEAYQLRGSDADVFRKNAEGGVVMLSSAEWLGASLFYLELRGRYRFRMSVSGVQSDGKPVVFRVNSGGGGMGGAKAHLVSYFDALPGEARVIEFEDHMEPKTGIFLTPYGLGNPSALKKMGVAAWTGPGLAVDWVEMIGPLNDVWPPLSHQRLFGELKQISVPNPQRGPHLEVTSDDPPADAQRILERFARRAFRRPASSEEIAPYVALVLERLGEGSSFEYATRAGLAALMTSPQFLFLREKPGQLDDYALASRAFSYFLWSSMPDDALLETAEQGVLNHPEVLRAQVERLLQSPKAAAFTENFTGQWLRLRDIDFTEPSQQLYPEFDDMLKESMLREARLFFDEVLKGDLSVTNFLASDFAMLNGRLVKHYGIPGVHGWGFQRVALPPESHRGGVLTMGAVLKVTANGTNTSPVQRGAWVLDRLLGTPPKPPPADAGTIEPDIRGATTMREQLAKHRRNGSCNTCHAKIDPPGFALENFDVIGGWREYYRSTGNGKEVQIDGHRMPYFQGKPVDADVLPDGRKFANVDEFKQLLLADPDAFARALAAKLLTYATGGVIEPSDRRELEAIVAKAQASHLGFRTLIHEIVQSPLFREK